MFSVTFIVYFQSHELYEKNISMCKIKHFAK